MKAPQIFLICLILISTFSCTSDDVDNENQTSYRLTKLVTTSPDGSNISTFKYIYDEDKKLIKGLFEDGSIQIDYNYLGNNIISINLYTISEERITNYVYDGDLIISQSTEVLLNDQPTIFLDGYEYNEAMELIVDKFFVDNVMKCERTFVNENQNVSSITASCGGIFTYKYDSMKNPFQLLYNSGLSKILYQGPSNMVEEIDHESNSKRAYSYEYNSQGFPIKSFYYINDELHSIAFYTYENL